MTHENLGPAPWKATLGRLVGAGLVRSLYAARAHGAENVPSRGPVILAANHTGYLDGAVVFGLAPRPAHFLVLASTFELGVGPLLHLSGQIPLEQGRGDRTALTSALGVLERGGAVGIFPEGARGSGDLGRFHRGTAYLALTTGAPVVPVIMFGTRAAGGHKNALPPRGGPVDIVYGDPMALPAQPWPRTREQVAEASLLLREHMLALLQESLRLTGQTLPGPLPAGETDDDPHTGVVEQGAP